MNTVDKSHKLNEHELDVCKNNPTRHNQDRLFKHACVLAEELAELERALAEAHEALRASALLNADLYKQAHPAASCMSNWDWVHFKDLHPD